MSGAIVISGIGISHASIQKGEPGWEQILAGKLDLDTSLLAHPSELTEKLEREISQQNGTNVTVAEFSPRSKKDSGFRISGESSYNVYVAVKKALEQASVTRSRKGFDHKNTAVVNCILYQGLEREMGIKPFKFQTEHQSPAFIGDIFGLHGPHFSFKEGESAGLNALTTTLPLLTSGACSSVIISGVAQPNVLFTRIECLDEINKLQCVCANGEEPLINTSFSESAVAMVCELEDQAAVRDVEKPVKYLGGNSYHRSIDYSNPGQIRNEVRHILKSVVKHIDRQIGVIYIDNSWNRFIRDLQIEATRELFPDIQIISIGEKTGNCFQVGGLLNVISAGYGLQTGYFPTSISTLTESGNSILPRQVHHPEIECALVLSVSRLGGYSVVALGKPEI